MAHDTQVIVVGGGPVGTLLASELALAGIQVTVLEAEKSSRESPWKVGPPGLRGLNINSAQALARRGLLENILSVRPQQVIPPSKPKGPQFAGHFAGIMIDGNMIDYSQFKHHFTNTKTMGGPINVAELADAFMARAEEHGAKIVRGAAVTKIAEQDDYVEVWAGERKFTAQWVVGTDGAHSVVRKAGGFELVGSEAEVTGYVAVCEIHKDDQHLLHPGFNPSKEGLYITTPRGGQIYVLDFDGGAGRMEPVTLEKFQEVLRRASGTQVRVEKIDLPNAFTDRTKQVTEYRRGRLLLAGDSAHYHSPLGAQGLNCGIGDAMNLGFKLAATINGTAANGLLDTYHTERWPIGEAVLEWSRAQVALLRPDLAARASTKITRELLQTVGGATYYYGRFSGLSQRYDLGSEDDLVGRYVPDFVFTDGIRVSSSMTTGSWTLLDFSNEKTSELEAIASSQVSVLSGVVEDTLGLKTLLVRPDGVVALTSIEKAEPSQIHHELSRWVSS